MEDERQGLLNDGQQNMLNESNNESNRDDPDYIDFEAPDIAQESLPGVNTSRTLDKPQRIVLKYPDGSLSHGKRTYP